MVELQRLTGMRPGEVVILRAGDLDTAGDVWAYAPARHKTEYHGRSRAFFLGPRAQEMPRPWLVADPGAYLFSLAEAMRERRAARRDRSRPRPAKAPGERSLTGSGTPLELPTTSTATIPTS